MASETYGTETGISRQVARWESRSGKHHVTLYFSPNVGGHYYYVATGGSGTLAAKDDAAAIAELAPRVHIFQPDANKTPMRRVDAPLDPPAVAPAKQHQRHADETLPYEWSQRLAVHGFVFEGTGGNCTAYVRRDADGNEELITDGGHDHSAPTEIDARVVICLYDGDALDEPAEEVDHYTLADVLTVLEDPRDEYYLLTLRLANYLPQRAE